MLPLHPVPAALEDVQPGVGTPRDQLQAGSIATKRSSRPRITRVGHAQRQLAAGVHAGPGFRLQDILEALLVIIANGRAQLNATATTLVNFLAKQD